MIPLAGNKTRNCSIDIFRYICAFLVITIHTHPLKEHSFLADFIFVEVFGKIAVPFFFIVAGYFYVKKLEKGQPAFLSYLKRIFITYGLWSVVYIGLSYINYDKPLTSFIKETAEKFFTSGSYYHFWYFPALIFGLCLTTLLYKLRLKKLIIPLSIALFALGSFCQAYRQWTTGIDFVDAICSHPDFAVIHKFFMRGFPWFGCGLLVYHAERKLLPKLSNLRLFIVAAINFAVWSGEIYFIFSNNNNANFASSLSLYPLMVLILLILLKNPLPKLSKLSERCRILANFTYYSHPFFLFIFAYSGTDITNLNRFIFAFGTTLVIGLILSKFSKNKIVKLIAG